MPIDDPEFELHMPSRKIRFRTMSGLEEWGLACKPQRKFVPYKEDAYASVPKGFIGSLETDRTTELKQPWPVYEDRKF